MPDLPRLRRMLGGPETAWLVERVRERLAAGRPLDTAVVLAAASVEQRRAVELLLGRRLRAGRSLSVPLADVDRVLRESLACPDGLAAAVVLLTGPVADRRAEALASAEAWRAAFVPLDAACDRPDLAPWRARVESTGLLKRIAAGDPSVAGRLADQAARVLAELTADELSAGPGAALTLPVLAARCLGDAHALDEGRPLASLVWSAVKALAGLSDEEAGGAEGRRAGWAAVGVATDELSSRVLTLGLPGSTHGTTGRILAAAREGGEPCVLTLRQLAAGVGAVPESVRVCENPAVVAAAAASLGADCPPLVCVEGNVSLAARTLLGRLAERGSRLAYHGDFDWGGVRIAAGLLRLPGAVPWRYDHAAYLAAVERGLGAPLTTGTPAPTLWDPALREAIEAHGVRVEEELVLGELLADLRGSCG
ncbi:TIGR02679 family protein [Kitasatospora sp. NBC_01302]|uniref:TIGR02679 family protein n=1 Tax=Kitasatospora sp. NBC_01302 TaxID=2903575 RepID=UPI002E14D433|nr:TIGR02679 family protein [Kitasatospora sp. NBC_01302]